MGGPVVAGVSELTTSEESGLSCSAYAIADNARLSGSRFVGRVELRAGRGYVSLSGRRVSAWWLCWRPLGVLWSVSWRAGQSRLLHGFTSRTEGLPAEPVLYVDAEEAYEVPAVSQPTKYTVVQLEVPLGRRGGMRLLQLEVPDHEVRLLKQVLSGVPLGQPLV